MTLINEDAARRSKENMSFSDYRAGSATEEYNAVIADATEKIESAKQRVSDDGRERLDKLLNWYKAAYAGWINKYNANGAGHVSIMISGPANYNMRAHEKYLSREGKLWEEYNDIKDISHKIRSIIDGDKIITSGASPSLAKAAISALQRLHEEGGD